MGLFDHLFKSKPESTGEKDAEVPVKAAGAAAAEKGASGGTTAPDPSIFRQPKSHVPRGANPLVPHSRPTIAPNRPPERRPPPITPTPVAIDEISLTVGDIIPRIPPHFLRAGHHEPKRELRFHLDDLSADIARGRATVALSRVAALCPDLFHSPIVEDEDMEIRLPLQKLLEQFGRIRSPGRPPAEAAGVFRPLPAAAPAEVSESSALENPPEILARKAPAATGAAQTEADAAASAPEETTPAPLQQTASEPGKENVAPVNATLLADSAPDPKFPAPVATTLANAGIAEQTEVETAHQEAPAPTAAATDASPLAEESAVVSGEGEEQISLSIAAIFAGIPTHRWTGTPPDVEESLRISLPFAPIERQLASGKVELSTSQFVSALPENLRDHFKSFPHKTVPLPLEEIFQNLPVSSPAEQPIAAVGQLNLAAPLVEPPPLLAPESPASQATLAADDDSLSPELQLFPPEEQITARRTEVGLEAAALATVVAVLEAAPSPPEILPAQTPVTDAPPDAEPATSESVEAPEAGREIVLPSAAADAADEPASAEMLVHPDLNAPDENELPPETPLDFSAGAAPELRDDAAPSELLPEPVSAIHPAPTETEPAPAESFAFSPPAETEIPDEKLTLVSNLTALIPEEENLQPVTNQTDASLPDAREVGEKPPAADPLPEPPAAAAPVVHLAPFRVFVPPPPIFVTPQVAASSETEFPAAASSETALRPEASAAVAAPQLEETITSAAPTEEPAPIEHSKPAPATPIAASVPPPLVTEPPVESSSIHGNPTAESPGTRLEPERPEEPERPGAFVHDSPPPLHVDPNASASNQERVLQATTTPAEPAPLFGAPTTSVQPPLGFRPLIIQPPPLFGNPSTLTPPSVPAAELEPAPAPAVQHANSGPPPEPEVGAERPLQAPVVEVASERVDEPEPKPRSSQEKSEDLQAAVSSGDHRGPLPQLAPEQPPEAAKTTTRKDLPPEENALQEDLIPADPHRLRLPLPSLPPSVFQQSDELLPVPPALPLKRFDHDALQALFMTDETLDLPKISRFAAALPGIQACVIATREQAVTGGSLPDGFDLAALLGLAPRVGEAAGRLPIGALKHFTLYGDRYSVSFFERRGLSVCAVHRAPSFVPGVREKLVAIADELATS